MGLSRRRFGGGRGEKWLQDVDGHVVLHPGQRRALPLGRRQRRTGRWSATRPPTRRSSPALRRPPRAWPPSLDRELGLVTDGDLLAELGRPGREVAAGPRRQPWYFLLPDGELYRWDGGGEAAGTLVGMPRPATTPTRPARTTPGRPAATPRSASPAVTLTIDREGGFVGQPWLVTVSRAETLRAGRVRRASPVRRTTSIPPALTWTGDRHRTTSTPSATIRPHASLPSERLRQARSFLSASPRPP